MCACAQNSRYARRTYTLFQLNQQRKQNTNCNTKTQCAIVVADVVDHVHFVNCFSLHEFILFNKHLLHLHVYDETRATAQMATKQ